MEGWSTTYWLQTVNIFAFAWNWFQICHVFPCLHRVILFFISHRMKPSTLYFRPVLVCQAARPIICHPYIEPFIHSCIHVYWYVFTYNLYLLLITKHISRKLHIKHNRCYSISQILYNVGLKAFGNDPPELAPVAYRVQLPSEGCNQSAMPSSIKRVRRMYIFGGRIIRYIVNIAVYFKIRKDMWSYICFS